MWHRFGQGFREIILSAVEQLDAGEDRDLSTRHLMSALAAERELPAVKILAQMGISPEAVEAALEQVKPGERPQDGEESGLTREAREAVERAYLLAAELDDEYIGGEHLLLAFVREPEGSDAGRALAHLGVTWERAGQALLAAQKWRIRPPNGLRVPGSRLRRLKARARGKAGRIKRLAYGLSHYQMPFMPYLIFRKRSTDNPYPLYARLRCQPAYYDSLMQHWIVTRYQEVVPALAEPRFSQRVFEASAWSHVGLPALVHREFRCLQNGLDRQMLFQDAPAQPRQRLLVAKRFTPRVIAQMQDQMQQIANELLDSAQKSGRMDVIADLAVPFPLLVITRMLGLPADHLACFKKWSQDYFLYLTFETTLADDFAAYRSVQEAAAYFRALLPARRLRPEDDLISLLLQADGDGDCLPEDEVVANCLLLLATGHENTTRLLSSGLLALLQNPEQWQKLCGDPSLAASAIEELLRFDSPVQWTLRHVQEDTEWLGHTLKKGQRVQIGIGPANRDPAQFSQPDRLDITRSDNRHVAFGNGPHFCLGASLTRLETQIVFGTLAARFPRLRLAKPPEWRQEGLAFRGLQSLHVLVD